jgi:hypothetical protein
VYLVFVICLSFCTVLGSHSNDWVLGSYKGTAGTKLQIKCVGEHCCSPICVNDTFTGTLWSLVLGDSPYLEANVTGLINPSIGLMKWATITFITNWRFIGMDNKHIVASMSWTGEVRSSGTVNTMSVHWLLTRWSIIPANGWDRTSIGFDEFIKD